MLEDKDTMTWEFLKQKKKQQNPHQLNKGWAEARKKLEHYQESYQNPQLVAGSPQREVLSKRVFDPQASKLVLFYVLFNLAI